MIGRNLAGWLGTLLVCSISFAAADPTPFDSARMPAAPKIDGRIDPGEWPTPLEASGFDEDTGAVLQVVPTLYLGYDQEYVYFAARVPNPSGRLVADEYRSNVGLGGNDRVDLLIDTYGTGTSRNRFGVNPQGATSISIAGGRAAKVEWIGEFQAAGRIDKGFWEVEARVPWAVMPLPGSGPRDLRANFEWYTSATQRDGEWRFTNNDSTRMPVWKGVDLPKIAQNRELLMLPYGYLGVNDAGGEIFNTGLDLKTALTPDVQLVGTLNPDFRNVENQILSLDFSYFERLAEESRPFFAEGAGYRSFGFDSQLFASQRIRSFDAGLNTYGNLGGKTQFSLLGTARFGDEAATAASITHQIRDTTVARAAYVNWDKPGEANQSGQLALEHRFGEFTSGYVSAQQTTDQIEGTGRRYNVGLNYGRDGGFVFGEYMEVSPEFFPRIGFIRETDLKGFVGGGGIQRSLPKGSLMEFEAELFGWNWDYFNGGSYRRGFGGSLSFTFRNAMDLDIGFESQRFREFDDRIAFFSLEQPRDDPYRRWVVNYSIGDIAGERLQSFEVGLRYRPLPRLQTNFNIEWLDHIENARQLIFGANYEIGRFESIGGRAVMRDNDWNGYMSYRRSGTKGTEFFLIIGDPNSRTFQRTIIMKIVVPVSLRL